MKKTILVGEDDEAISDIIQSILQSEDYNVLLACTEDEIQQHLHSSSPDLIFLDIWLAGQDGSQIAKSIKAEQATQSIPLIVMSADTNTAQIAGQIGADDYLLKPFSLEHLLTLASKYTKRNNIIRH